MNDKEEIEKSWNILIIRLKSLLIEPDRFSYYEFAALKKGIFDDANFYIVSFSENPSILSQWRAYGGPKGVSFGIPKSLFLQSDDRKIFKFSYVSYDPKDHIAILDPIANRLADIINGQAYISESLFFDIGKSFRKEFCSIAPFIKHPAFSEEREFRGVYIGDQIIPKERPDGRGLYVPLNLEDIFENDIGEDYLFNTIILSPYDDIDEYVKEVTAFMRSSKENFFSIASCGIPYRG